MIRRRIKGCVEAALLQGQSPKDIRCLLHKVVVGGGMTGIEFTGELPGFFEEDLKKQIPEIRDEFRITLEEACLSLAHDFGRTS